MKVCGIHRQYHVIGLFIITAVFFTLAESPQAEEYYNLPAVIDNNLVITIDQSPCAVPYDVVITQTGSLTIEAGVALYIHPQKIITVHGELTIAGTEAAPVTVTTASIIPTERWGRIKGSNGTLSFDHVSFSGCVTAIDQTGKSLTIRDCTFSAEMPGEVVHAQYATVLIERSTFGGGHSDTIDFEGVYSATISNCVIYSADDDGIDVGENSGNITITDTQIYGCNDKAISVGQNSSVTISACILADSEEGVTVFDGAEADIDRSTIIGYQYGIHCKDDSNDGIGGDVTVTNSIIDGLITIDTESTGVFSYCLSTVSYLGSNNGNIFGNPLFYNAIERDFRLFSDSPAIDTASPDLASDPDGSPAEIGAVVFHPQSLVINEIHYASYNTFDPGDWIELYNPGIDTVHVAGWTLLDDNDANNYELPRNAIVPPGDFMVLCRDLTAFSGLYPESISAVGDLGFGFTSGGELIRLFDGRSVVIDSLTFGTAPVWPEGPTIALTSPLGDNANPENWTTSLNYGTPGAQNDYVNAVSSGASHPMTFSLGASFPNPFNPRTIIPYTLTEAGHVILEIYSLQGQRVDTLVNERLSPGDYSVAFEPSSLASGCYVISLTLDGARLTQPVMYVK